MMFSNMNFLCNNIKSYARKSVSSRDDMIRHVANILYDNMKNGLSACFIVHNLPAVADEKDTHTHTHYRTRITRIVFNCY